ncbi:MAG: alkaline phosphatase, partial [Symploca sp. SIO2G7]|nr:alkaline phosphatase [Symploca sp. SIO2G7]
YHDLSEEELAELGLDNYLDSAPSVAEMTEFALRRLQKNPNGFLLVIEEEGTDNMCNRRNASGCLEAMKRADDAIGVIQAHLERSPSTFMVMASDSNANGPQVLHAPITLDELAASDAFTGSAIDGISGTGSAPFVAEPDAQGNRYAFAIGWASGFDVGSGVIARGAGLDAEQHFPPTGIDNTDIYRMLYYTLFGVELGD